MFQKFGADRLFRCCVVDGKGGELGASCLQRVKYLEAEDWNNYLSDEETVVIDMRNHYESEVGRFENADCPDADTFREELKRKKFLLSSMVSLGHLNTLQLMYSLTTGSCTGLWTRKRQRAWMRRSDRLNWCRRRKFGQAVGICVAYKAYLGADWRSEPSSAKKYNTTLWKNPTLNY